MWRWEEGTVWCFVFGRREAWKWAGTGGVQGVQDLAPCRRISVELAVAWKGSVLGWRPGDLADVLLR